MATPLIPADHIPQRRGAPECFELMPVAVSGRPPVVVMALSSVLSPEEIAAAKADLAARVEAVSVLTGAEIPPEIAAAIEQLDSDDDALHRAVVGDPFEICWN